MQHYSLTRFKQACRETIRDPFHLYIVGDPNTYRAMDESHQVTYLKALFSYIDKKPSYKHNPFLIDLPQPVNFFHQPLGPEILPSERKTLSIDTVTSYHSFLSDLDVTKPAVLIRNSTFSKVQIGSIPVSYVSTITFSTHPFAPYNPSSLTHILYFQGHSCQHKQMLSNLFPDLSMFDIASPKFFHLRTL